MDNSRKQNDLSKKTGEKAPRNNMTTQNTKHQAKAVYVMDRHPLRRGADILDMY